MIILGHIVEGNPAHRHWGGRSFEAQPLGVHIVLYNRSGSVRRISGKDLNEMNPVGGSAFNSQDEGELTEFLLRCDIRGLWPSSAAMEMVMDVDGEMLSSCCLAADFPGSGVQRRQDQRKIKMIECRREVKLIRTRALHLPSLH